MTEYEIRVLGPVSTDAAERLGLDASVAPVDSRLRGKIEDGAALHGILAELSLLDIELIEVRRLP